MKRFDIKGMMVFPNPISGAKLLKEKELLVVKECFCHNGHDLVSDRAMFDGLPGIVLKLKKGNRSGLVALNPVYGYKSRISIDVQLKKDETWKICCPVCNEPLPVFSACNCEGDLTALFLDKKADFFNCILVCNRIDCHNAQIKYNNEIIYYPGETALK
jgi:hypothetical protein